MWVGSKTFRSHTETFKDMATGRPVIASFEPGGSVVLRLRTGKPFAGPKLFPPLAHPLDQPVPGPEGPFPPDWEVLLHERTGQRQSPRPGRRGLGEGGRMNRDRTASLARLPV